MADSNPKWRSRVEIRVEARADVELVVATESWMSEVRDGSWRFEVDEIGRVLESCRRRSRSQVEDFVNIFVSSHLLVLTR